MSLSVSKRMSIIALAAFLWGGLVFPSSSEAAEVSKIERLSGQTKYQTAVEIALKINPGIVPAVVLASPMSYSDALASIPLTKEKEAPLLWVGQNVQDSNEALKYVADHCDKRGMIYILGGEGVIPKSIEKSLYDLGFREEQVLRLEGSNRYETAVEIAQAVGDVSDTVYITSGEDYSQAASTAVLSAATGNPIVFVPSKGTLPEKVIKYLNKFATNEEVSFQIIGNEKVIPEDFITELQTKVKGLAAGNIVRMSGDNLYDLMAEANRQVWIKDRMQREIEDKVGISQILLTTGKGYADAIAGAVLAAQVQAPLIFIDKPIPLASASLLKEFYEYNEEVENLIAKVTVLGGNGVLPAKIVAEADSLFYLGLSLQSQAQVWTYAELDLFSAPFFAIKGEGEQLILSDPQTHSLKTISGDKEVQHLVGKSDALDAYGMPLGGYFDGDRAEALFNEPSGIALDKKGVIYVADAANGAIRLMDQEGRVKTLVNGLNRPTGIALDKEGALYVTESLNHRILKISPQGEWSVFAGGGYELKNGELEGGLVDGQGEKAKFNEPQGIAMDTEGNLYIADTGNQRIRKVSPDGKVSTVAGSGQDLIENTSYRVGGYRDGESSSALFNFPTGIAVDKDKKIYVADSLNHCIRVITPEGKVDTLAGRGDPGKGDGVANLAQFYNPTDILLWEQGTLLIIDQGNALIRHYVPARS